MSVTYHLTVNIDQPGVLIGAKKNLCVAIAVDGAYNLVWTGDMTYAAGYKNFYFTNNYKVTAAYNQPSDGNVPVIDEISGRILEDQTVIYNSNGKFGSTTGRTSAYKPIYVNNKYGGEVHLGLQVADDSGTYKNISLTKPPAKVGYNTLYPLSKDTDMPSAMIWFDDNLATGQWFSRSLNNPHKITFNKGVDNFVVNYAVINADSGIWTNGDDEMAFAPRTYDPQTNTFKVDEVQYVDPESIKIWNARVDEGITWHRENVV